jgi:hypothetical protein
MSPPRERALTIALLAAMAVQLGLGLGGDGLTVDELPYIGCGYRHLVHSDFRMNPEQPPLAKMIAAAPLVVLHPVEPEPPVGDDQIGWPDRFLHVWNRHRPLLAFARAPFVVLSLLLAALIGEVARRLYGPEAGLFALALAAFHPSLLAHGHLATTDLLSALTLFAASLAFWEWSRRPRPAMALAVAGALGLAVTTRFTAWLLPVVFAALEGLSSARGRRSGRQVLSLLGLCAVEIPLVTWAAYGFHYRPWPGESVAQAIDPALGLGGSLIACLLRGRVLPEAYLEGLRFQLEHNRVGHWGYLLGETGSAWRHYYVVAWLVKNTPGFLILTAMTLVFLWRRGRRLFDRGEEHWLLPPLVLFTVASLGRLQLGERYILAVYPYAIVLAAGAAAMVRKWRGGVPVLAAVLVLHILPALSVAGRGDLTYFNFIAGGPDGGHRFLADSNLDWGQDLPRLAAWMRAHDVREIQLGYFGSDDPDRYGIAHQDLPTWGANRPQQPAARPFEGTIAVSPNLYLGLFFPPESDPYAFLRNRPPDDRAGIFFIYRLPPRS